MNDREQLLQSLIRSKQTQAIRESRAAFERRCLVFALLGVIGLVSFFNFNQNNKNTEQDDRLDKIEITLQKHADQYTKMQDDFGLELNGLKKVDTKILKELQKKQVEKKIVKSPYHAKKRNIVIANALVSRGFPKDEAAAITGNIMIESSGNPKVIGDNGTSGGLMQWHDTKKNYGRFTNLKKYAYKKNKHWTDFNVQLDYVKHEMKNNKKYKIVKACNGVSGKAECFARHIERPALWALKQSLKHRIVIAELTAKEIG